MKAKLFKDGAGEWRWTLYADNGEPIAVASESYRDRRDALHGLQLTVSAGETAGFEVEDPTS